MPIHSVHVLQIPPETCLAVVWRNPIFVRSGMRTVHIIIIIIIII